MFEHACKFIKELFIGAFIFISVAAVAVALSLFVRFLEENKISRYITGGLTAIEYLMFGVDLILMFIFILRTSIDLGKALWNH